MTCYQGMISPFQLSIAKQPSRSFLSNWSFVTVEPRPKSDQCTIIQPWLLSNEALPGGSGVVVIKHFFAFVINTTY